MSILHELSMERDSNLMFHVITIDVATARPARISTTAEDVTP
jgi:hypothetical protein